jgi:heme o synthase
MSATTLPASLLRQATLSARDYAELTKLRVTTLIVLTAWAGYFFAARQAGLPVVSWALLHALVGIGLASSGTAALNEVMERDIDGLMRRTARRPLPSGRMPAWHGLAIGLLLTVGGSLYLWAFDNFLTAGLTFLTSVVYLAAYTPLKQVSPWCTFVGAFPGAMPCVLGWTAARGKISIETLVLFAIMFLWQFPHFFSIAWLYRDDYAAGGIRMLPVVEPSGRSTAQQIIVYSRLLIPVSMLPGFIGMTYLIYSGMALLLGAGFLFYGTRLTSCGLPATSPASKPLARQLLRVSVLYLPTLLAIMMMSARH